MNVTFTELETNLSFDAEINTLPGVTKNYSTVFVNEQEVKRSGTSQLTGTIEATFTSEPNNTTKNFLENWYTSKKRIEIMLETGTEVYLLKYCFLKKLDFSNKICDIFYNSYRKA